jgi:hypothetical protein
MGDLRHLEMRLGYLKGKYHLECQDVDGKMKLKHITISKLIYKMAIFFATLPKNNTHILNNYHNREIN